MTRWRPCSSAASAWRTPARGSPVASTSTSSPDAPIRSMASSVRWVRPLASAAPQSGASSCSSGQPAPSSEARARSGFRSATPSTCRPGVRRAWARNMVPNLPPPITPTRIGRPASALRDNRWNRFMAAPRRPPARRIPVRSGQDSRVTVAAKGAAGVGPGINQQVIKKKEAEASPASDALRAVPFPAYVHVVIGTGFPQPVQDPCD